MDNFDLYEFLLESNPTRVYYKHGGFKQCWHNNCSIYFQSEGGGTYNRFELDEDERIAKYLDDFVVRIEKKMDDEYFPIWTREDGIIEDYSHFVKVRGKYYSIKQLESIFEEIETIKKNVNSIHI